MPEEGAFSPADTTFANLNGQMEAGCAKIQADGALVVDLGQMRRCNTATVCLLMELQRAARQKNCRLRVINADRQLVKLLNLYQLGAWWAEASAA